MKLPSGRPSLRSWTIALASSKWKLVQEFRLPAPKNKSIIVDGVVLDSFTLKHGFWEAKDLQRLAGNEAKKNQEQHLILRSQECS